MMENEKGVIMIMKIPPAVKDLFLIYITIPAIEAALAIMIFYYYNTDVAVVLSELLSSFVFAFVVTLFMHFICTSPASLVRFLVLRRPIVRVFNIMLAICILSPIGKVLGSVVAGSILNKPDYKLKGGAIFFYIANYLLLTFGKERAEPPKGAPLL